MSCQIKDYQEVPLKRQRRSTSCSPISCLQNCQRNGVTTRKVLGKGEEEERNKWVAKKPDNYKQRVRRK